MYLPAAVLGILDHEPSFATHRLADPTSATGASRWRDSHLFTAALEAARTDVNGCGTTGGKHF